MGPEKAGLQPDGFLQQLGALPEPVLLKANGAQHRTGRGARLGIGERQLGLLVGFLEPPFLDQDGRPLEGLPPLGTPGADRRQSNAQEHRRRDERRARVVRPARHRLRFALAESDALGSPLRHDYHHQ